MALSDNLQGYWKFDETSGTNVNDSISDHDGTASRTNILNNAGGILGYKGVFASASSDKVNIVNHADLRPTSAFSVQAWINKGSGTTYNDIFDTFSQVPTPPSGFRLGVDIDDAHDHKACLMIGGSSGSPIFVWSTTSVDDSAWHYLVGTWDGTHMKLYVDGTQEGGDVDGENPVYQSYNNINIGVCEYMTGSFVSYFNGSIDEVAVWNRALSSTEVTTLWNSGAGLDILSAPAITTSVKDFVCAGVIARPR